MDLSDEQILAWERLVLQQPIDFDVCKVDPAPFQLVERTSLYKVRTTNDSKWSSQLWVDTISPVAHLTLDVGWNLNSISHTWNEKGIYDSQLLNRVKSIFYTLLLHNHKSIVYFRYLFLNWHSINSIFKYINNEMCKCVLGRDKTIQSIVLNKQSLTFDLTLQVHSIFSLLSLHHAYVTNMGKLVGIVSMSEVNLVNFGMYLFLFPFSVI